MIWLLLLVYWVGATCYLAGIRRGRVLPSDFESWSRDQLAIGPERRAALRRYLLRKPGG